MKLAFLGTGLAARIHSKTMKAVAPGVERFYASRDLARAEAARGAFNGAGAIAFIVLLWIRAARPVPRNASFTETALQGS